MNPIVDTIMLILFVLFMFAIFGGYHRDKYAKREEQEQKEKETDSKEA